MHQRYIHAVITQHVNGLCPQDPAFAHFPFGISVHSFAVHSGSLALHVRSRSLCKSEVSNSPRCFWNLLVTIKPNNCLVKMKTDLAAAWFISHLKCLHKHILNTVSKQAAMLVRFEITEQTSHEWRLSGSVGVIVGGSRSRVQWQKRPCGHVP